MTPFKKTVLTFCLISSLASVAAHACSLESGDDDKGIIEAIGSVVGDAAALASNPMMLIAKIRSKLWFMNRVKELKAKYPTMSEEAIIRNLKKRALETCSLEGSYSVLQKIDFHPKKKKTHKNTEELRTIRLIEAKSLENCPQCVYEIDAKRVKTSQETFEEVMDVLKANHAKALPYFLERLKKDAAGKSE